MSLRQDVFKECIQQLIRGQRLVVACLVATEGSTYQKPGASMLVTESGEWHGLLSGGCLEADIALRARQCFETEQSQVVTYNTTEDGDVYFGTGLGCKGQLTIFLVLLGASDITHSALSIDPTTSDPLHGLQAYLAARVDAAGYDPKPWLTPNDHHLVIFGAGVDARVLCKWAVEMDWHVTVIDPRAAYAKKDFFPDAAQVICQGIDASSVQQVIECRGPHCSVVVMTHNFERDHNVMTALVNTQCDYIGVLGPRRRTDELISQLSHRDRSRILSRLRSPVGLNLGGYGPEAVALSILSELQAFRGRKQHRVRLQRTGVEDLDVIILAAGQSTRMGQAKQLLRRNGESLIQSSVRTALDAGFKKVHVVTGALAKDIAEELNGMPINLIVNSHFESGLSSSIRAGLSELPLDSRGVLFMTCDQPLVHAEDIKQLTDYFLAGRGEICAAQYSGVIGVPAIFSSIFYPSLMVLEGDRGARGLIERFANHVFAMPCERARFDIDTPDDWAKVSGHDVLKTRDDASAKEVIVTTNSIEVSNYDFCEC